MNYTSQRERLSESIGVVRFTVYADFNCPFCYALNERLFALNLAHQVDFRLIQHVPEVSSEQTNLEMISNLTAEVAEVRRRTPSTEIAVPMFRPNTAAASALVYTVGQQDPVDAARLRRRIYRALWVESQDISKSWVLAALMLELDIEMPRRDYLCNDELSAWQSEWENNTEFERGLPIVISESGETVIGCLLEPELDAFLDAGSLVTEPVLNERWSAPRRQRVLVLDDDATSLRMIVEQMHDAQVEVVEDFIGLVAHARNLGMPDLLVVNTALIGHLNGPDWWRNLTNSDPDPAIPIIHILDEASAEAEAVALMMGAADVIARPFHPRLLRSRLNTNLQARRAQQQRNVIARVDGLTSICNRREFDSRLFVDWGRSARSGDPLALLMIDVDRLRAYNDSHGHLRGDECLVTLAQRLGTCMQRSGDLIARYNGGLFTALLPGIGIESAAKVARDCHQAVAEARIPHPASTLSPYVSVSIGVASMVPKYEQNCSLIMEQAESALFQAKQGSHNPVSVFDASLHY